MNIESFEQLSSKETSFIFFYPEYLIPIWSQEFFFC